MSTFNAGAIEANLSLGRSDWKRDLRQTKKEIQDLENTTITIGIDADDDNARIVMDNLERMLEDLDGNTYKPTISLEDSVFQSEIDQINRQLSGIDDKRVAAMVFLDDDNAQVSLDNLQRDLDSLDRERVSIPVDMDTSKAEAEIDKIWERVATLDGNDVNLDVNVNTATAQARLDVLAAFLEYIETDYLNIHVDVDSGAAEAKLLALAQFMQVIEMNGVDIGVDVDGYAGATARMANLQRQIAILNGQDIDIDVDVDRAALQSLLGSASGGASGGGGYLGLFKILIYSIIALSPVLSAAIGASTAAILGFSAALVGAGGAAVVLAGGLVGLITRFKDTDPSQYTPAMQEFADALDEVKDAASSFLDSIEDSGFGLMANALGLAADILPTLAPLFNATAGAMDGVVDSIRSFTESSEYQEMLDFFEGFGVDMLESFLQVGGNLLRFFGRLFQAMEPFARIMMAGLENVTAGWAEWADDLENNEAFQRFIDASLEKGPMLLDMLGSLVDAFINIGEALEPFAGPMIEGLTFIFDAIAGLDPSLLTAIIAGFAGLWLGLNVLAPLIGAVAGGLGTLTAVLGIGLGPIALIVGGLVALGIAIYDLWQNNEDFRNSVIETWETLQETIEPIVQDIVTAIQENWGPITEWASELWGDFQNIIVDAMAIIEQVVKAAAIVITYVWTNFGDDIIRIVKGAVQMAAGQIRGFFQIIRGIFQTIRAVLTGDWRGAWEGIKNIGRGAMTMIQGWIRGFGNVLGGILGIIRTQLRNSFSEGWEDAKSKTRGAIDWIKNRFSDMVGWFKSLPGKISSAVSGLWKGIGDEFRSVINGVIRMWNNLSFSVDIPDKIPGLPDSFKVSTPNAPYLAKGAYLTEPTLNVAGEAGPEIVAPEPVLERIVRDNSGGSIDYGKIAAAVAAALAAVLPRGITAEDLERLIEAASVNIEIDATNDDGRSAAKRIASALGFELRTLGYGGKYA